MFWKIQDICYQMGTEIFKIEEEMTEKMKPEVANPPSKNRQNSLLTLCTHLMILCIFMTCNETKTQNLFHTLVEGQVMGVLHPWPDVSSSRTIMSSKMMKRINVYCEQRNLTIYGNLKLNFLSHNQLLHCG